MTTCISNCRGYTESIPGLCGFSNKGISSLKFSIFHGWWFCACAPSKLSRNTALNSTKTRDVTDIFSHRKRRECTRSMLSIHSLLKHYETEKNTFFTQILKLSFELLFYHSFCSWNIRKHKKKGLLNSFPEPK